MEKYQWVKDLILSEQDMEEQGLVDLHAAPHSSRTLEIQTIQFLREMKQGFTDAANTYNSFKKDSTQFIKIYGVSRTLADFMLFRNGFKLIFSMTAPGTIQIYSSHLPTSFIPGTPTEESGGQPIRHIVSAKWGAFDELQWTYKSEPIRLESLIRYYLSFFSKHSA